MMKIILLALLFSQGGSGEEGILSFVCKSILSHPLFCLLSNTSTDVTQSPPSPSEQITFHAWTTSLNGSIQEYILPKGDDAQMQEIFNGTKRASISAYFHGINQTGKQDWILKIKDLYFTTNYGWRYVIISLDYQKLVPDQKQAALNVKLISDIAADFLNWTSGFVPKKDFYIESIGHGMGAYIAGATMKKLKEIMTYKISPWLFIALDPDHLSSETLGLTASNPLTIDRSQAVVVIVYHTSTCSYTPPIEACNENLSVTLGHYDFYPNGGISQTGCSDSTCDKNRAPQLLIEEYISYPNWQLLKAFPCKSFGNFKNGLCTSCIRVGCPTMSQRIAFSYVYGRFYLYTNAEAPYGRGLDQSKP